MQLVESGRLTLDTKLSNYYPQLPNAEKITVEHLLRHRSGLVNFTNTLEYFEFNEKAQTKQGMLERFIENGTEFEPDEKYRYSNTGYVLLAYVNSS